MRYRALNWLALAGALALAGCGGGNPTPPTLSSVASVNAASTAPSTPPAGGFKQMVVFGDSLSDDGAYTLAAVSTYSVPPYNISFTGLPYPGGGQFTVNGAPTGNWTNVLASSLKIPGLTPNIIGYYSPQAGGFAYLTPGGVTTNQSSAFCAFSAPPNSGMATCTNFAQGGSLVSNPVGIGNPQNTASPGGAMTYPVSQQVSNYLTQFGSFNANQLVTVLAGNNDIFTALSTVSANVNQAVTQAATQAAQSGTPLTQAQIAQLQAQATQQQAAKAQATVAAAADQLSAQVQKIIANGAKYVLVFTLPDSSLTPFGQSLSGGTTCDNTDIHTPCYLLSNLVQVFNQRLLNDLQGQPVKMVDGFALLNAEIKNPAQFGLSNVTTPWCNLQQVPSSLLCNVGTPNTDAGATLSNLGTWLFADGVHPTPAGYQIVAQQTYQAMQSFGWVPQQ